MKIHAAKIIAALGPIVLRRSARSKLTGVNRTGSRPFPWLSRTGRFWPMGSLADRGTEDVWSARRGGLPAQRDHLPAIGDDGGAGDKAAGIRRQQQKRAVKIAFFAEPADRDVALNRGAALGCQIIAIHLGDDPAGRDGVDANTFEREFERQRPSQLNDARLGGGIGDHAFVEDRKSVV